MPVTTRGEQSIPSYLLRLLTAIAIKHGGEVRIPVAAMAEAQVGTGVSYHFDAATKEVVVRVQPEGSEVFFIKEGSWQQRAPATPERLQLEEHQPSPSRVLTDEAIADLETQRRHRRILREVEQLPPSAIRRTQ